MFWKKKIPDAKKTPRTKLEDFILACLIESLSKDDGYKLKSQLSFLPLIKRIQYPKDVATEFYPEKFDAIPTEILFDKKEEFCIADISFQIIKSKYKCQVFFVLGALFEIRIKPSPPINDEMDVTEIENVQCRVNEY